MDQSPRPDGSQTAPAGPTPAETAGTAGKGALLGAVFLHSAVSILIQARQERRATA